MLVRSCRTKNSSADPKPKEPQGSYGRQILEHKHFQAVKPNFHTSGGIEGPLTRMSCVRYGRKAQWKNCRGQENFSCVPKAPGLVFSATYLRGKLAPSAFPSRCSGPRLPPQISHEKNSGLPPVTSEKPSCPLAPAFTSTPVAQQANCG
jgi:hypothetical protein